MKFNDLRRVCHAESIRFSQGKLHEGSVALSTKMLRFAQHDKAGHFC